MDPINIKLDAKADLRTVALLSAGVFVAARAGARRVARKMDSGRPLRPYTRYDRMSSRRPARADYGNWFKNSVADIVDGAAERFADRVLPRTPRQPYNPPAPEYGEHVRTQRALDRINNRLDAIVSLIPEKTEVSRVPDSPILPQSAVETKDGNPVSVLLDNRQEAMDLINAMSERAETYEACTVSDLYDLLGVKSKFVDGKWGWTSTSDFVMEKEDEDDATRLLLPPAVKL